MFYHVFMTAAWVVVLIAIGVSLSFSLEDYKFKHLKELKSLYLVDKIRLLAFCVGTIVIIFHIIMLSTLIE